MRSAAQMRKMTAAGMDPTLAQAHAQAREELFVETFVTKEHFDARMAASDARFDRLEARTDA
jgi:hypothetical protein